MNTRLRISLLILAVLCAGNVAWRVWANWGLVTIDATDQPLAEVMHSLERQAHIRLATNVASDAKVTMHVHKVPLLHALDILAAAVNANWSLSYFTAADKAAIETGIASYVSSESGGAWKHFTLPPMRGGMGGMGVDIGSSDPRQDQWNVQPVSDGTLHGYLEQGSRVVAAQFWIPESWNPAISTAPKSGTVSSVLPKLTKAANGSSVEVFLLTAFPQFAPPTVNNDDSNASRTQRPPGGFNGGGMPSEEIRKAMEDRAMAQINKLPPDKKAEALAEFEGRKKFFADMANLTPEERMAKIQDAMEKMMNNTQQATKMESNWTKRGAMQTADQRNDFNRQMLSNRNK